MVHMRYQLKTLELGICVNFLQTILLKNIQNYEKFQQCATIVILLWKISKNQE
jgi:hypothetical protein